MFDRIYVCHTYYHVYVSLLKECNLPKEEWGKAEIALSTMSTPFDEEFPNRIRSSGMFCAVHILPEKRYTDFPELVKYNTNYNSFWKHMINRIIFTKKYAKMEEPYMTVDFAKYKDIYVYCDSDPIGYYLNAKHIYYHAMEDGLDCLVLADDAHVDNAGHFKIKALLAAMNIIFICNGYSKYCLDMEINSKDKLKYDCPKYKVVPRKELERNLTQEQKKCFIKTFMENGEEMLQKLQAPSDKKKCLLLTEPYHFDEKTQIQIVKDIYAQYCQGMQVVIKPHPMDRIDYTDVFPDCIVIKGRFPIEVMNFCEGVYFDKAVSVVTTAMNTLQFVGEKLNLGSTFWDAYEDHSLHDF